MTKPYDVAKFVIKHRPFKKVNPLKYPHIKQALKKIASCERAKAIAGCIASISTYKHAECLLSRPILIQKIYESAETGFLTYQINTAFAGTQLSPMKPELIDRTIALLAKHNQYQFRHFADSDQYLKGLGYALHPFMACYLYRNDYIYIKLLIFIDELATRNPNHVISIAFFGPLSIFLADFPKYKTEDDFLDNLFRILHHSQYNPGQIDLISGSIRAQPREPAQHPVVHTHSTRASQRQSVHTHSTRPAQRQSAHPTLVSHSQAMKAFLSGEQQQSAQPTPGGPRNAAGPAGYR